MGMFDYVKFECACPNCGTKMDAFQSKDAECVLADVEPSRVNEFYDSCLECSTWLSFKREQSDKFHCYIGIEDEQRCASHDFELKPDPRDARIAELERQVAELTPASEPDVIARISSVGNLSHMDQADLPKEPAMIIVFRSKDDCRVALNTPSRVRVLSWEEENHG